MNNVDKYKWIINHPLLIQESHPPKVTFSVEVVEVLIDEESEEVYKFTCLVETYTSESYIADEDLLTSDTSVESCIDTLYAMVEAKYGEY